MSALRKEQERHTLLALVVARKMEESVELRTQWVEVRTQWEEEHTLDAVLVGVHILVGSMEVHTLDHTESMASQSVWLLATPGRGQHPTGVADSFHHCQRMYRTCSDLQGADPQ